jgi:hypothetical protein
MKSPAKFRRPQNREERGVTMVLVAIAMVAIVAMAAMSIDLVTLYLAREEAQRSADAAALAAARIISVSGITGGGDPNGNTNWKAICGAAGSGGTPPAGLATQVAQAIGGQNSVGSLAATVSVNYSTGGSTTTDCSSLGAAFAVDPLITVQVQRQSLPTFFSRVWGVTGNTVTATATAEAFNPSDSGSNTDGGSTGTVTPVQPRCVKPWFVPNYDPMNPANCTTTNCSKFVNQSNGNIVNPGISLNGTNANGVIGESFWLGANCTHTGTGCTARVTPIQANYSGNSYLKGPPNLLYYPGEAPSSVVAVPSCSSAGDLYEQAIGGCDQSTVYKCGVAAANTIDMSENPATQNGDVTTGLQCLIHQGSPNGGLSDGQDALVDSSFPFQIQAGSSNPLVTAGLASGTQISVSNSIVSLPIYDPANTVGGSGSTNSVTVVGFLQVFINQVDQWDNINVTVLNVAGCGNGSGSVGTNPVFGSSPVPVRLVTTQTITPP